MTPEYLLTICPFAPFSLAQVIEDGSVMFDASIFQTQTPEPLAWTINLITTIGDILSLTHSTGITHGALVPGNILYAPKHFWLADFGLAGLHPPLPPYLAPELDSEIYYAHDDQKFVSFWNARSPASDQYALAMTYKRLFDIILPQAINHSTISILHKATNTNPQSRFANIAQLTQALIEQLTHKHAISLAIQQETASAVEQHAHSPQPTQQNNWEEKGNQAFRGHHYDLAVQAYQQATTLHPLNPQLWAALGDSLFATKQNEEAVEAYNKSLHLNPIQADIWMNRGAALERLGHRQEARACYKRATKLRHQS
jgi:tetratricopeptide (TPR) repeat protein